jgi:branched-chain amino acid transport system permease protein
MNVIELCINGLLFGSIYSLVAIGFPLIFGVLNRLNLAHGATMMVAAFAGATTSILLNGEANYGTLLLALLASLATGAVVGFVVRTVAFAPLRNASTLAPFVTSAAVALILQEVFVQLSRRISFYSPDFTAFPSPLEDLSFPIGSIVVRGAYVVIFVVALLLMGSLHFWLTRTQVGRAIRAAEENPTVSWLLGINVRRIEVIVFMVAGAIAGAAGCLIGVSQGSVGPFMGTHLMLVAFVIIVLAGLGSLYGAMVCGLLIGVVETVIVGAISASMKEAVLFVILFGALMVRPRGIFSLPAATRD